MANWPSSWNIRRYLGFEQSYAKYRAACTRDDMDGIILDGVLGDALPERVVGSRQDSSNWYWLRRIRTIVRRSNSTISACLALKHLLGRFGVSNVPHLFNVLSIIQSTTVAGPEPNDIVNAAKIPFRRRNHRGKNFRGRGVVLVEAR